jgi:cytochrome c oxidase subunit 2
MHIHPLERYWLIAIAIAIGAFVAAILASVFVFGVRLPGPAGRIDPKELAPKKIDNTEFAEPGLRHMGGNQYTAHILAQTWFFKPKEIRVPVGSEVTFIVTSKDVTHGFIIQEHDINMMLVPGQISRAKATFNRPGEYLIICHEYCGSGHQTMSGMVIVE